MRPASNGSRLREPQLPDYVENLRHKAPVNNALTNIMAKPHSWIRKGFFASGQCRMV